MWRQLAAIPYAEERVVLATGRYIVAMLFLFGTSALIVASIARGSIEVLTATALIGSGIPIFAAAEWLRGRRMKRLTAR